MNFLKSTALSEIVKSFNLRFFINGSDADGVDGCNGSGDVNCGDSIVGSKSDDSGASSRRRNNASFVEYIFLQCRSKISFLENT